MPAPLIDIRKREWGHKEAGEALARLRPLAPDGHCAWCEAEIDDGYHDDLWRLWHRGCASMALGAARR